MYGFRLLVFLTIGLKLKNLQWLHDLTMVHLNISNHAIITVKNVNHLCIFISLSESINLLKNSVIDERGYI